MILMAKNEKEELIGPHLKQFRDCLKQYGLEQKEGTLINAIKSSYISAGTHTVELTEKEAGTLRQIGIGWPTLGEAGKALGRELVESFIKKEPDILSKIIQRYPSQVVNLFLLASQKIDQGFSLRIPVEGQESENFILPATSIIDLARHKRIQSLLLELGHDLEREGLGVVHCGPAYRGAKWDAYFIDFPAAVAERLSEKQKSVTARLDKAEEAMRKLNLFKKLPIPTAREFNAAGLSQEMLMGYLGDACESGAISKLSEKGSAFLVFDERLYRNLVVIPLINNIIDMVLDEEKKTLPTSIGNLTNESVVPSATSESQLRNPIISSASPSSDFILIGSDKWEDQDRGLLGFTVDEGKKVELDMFVGKKQDEERAHTISVFGRPKAGKSYTLGVILEMALIPKKSIRSGQALPVVIFHYDKNTAYKPEFINAVHPTSIKQDAEFLKKLGTTPEGIQDAVILVPPWLVEERSAEFPGIKVCPLTFSTQELGLEEWKLLMGVPSSDTLYVAQMKQLLKDIPADKRTLKSIRDGVESSSISKQGKNLALTRLKLASEWIREGTTLQSMLKPGRLIILDIRAEMIDAPEAMRLCLICLGLLQGVQTEENLPMPKFIVLDEAHKYVQKDFAAEIVTVINQMRHTFTTVIIASQNPDSIPKEVMEKSSVVILHQITSPDQMSYVKKAVEGLSSVSGPVVASLKKGEAIVWAAESTDPLVSKKGIQVKIRPRFSCHV